MTADEKKLSELFERVSSEMSPYRFAHTVGVEREAMRLGELYLPDDLYELRAAALLHDITKELTVEENLDILRVNGVEITENILRSPKTLHARTAEFEARRCFPEYATDRVCQSLRYHTTGSENMTLFDAIIYLADYIEDTRTFEDCVYLRNYFWSAEPEKMTFDERERHLWRTVYLSLDMTVRDIESVGGYVSEETLTAKAAVMKRI